MALPTPSDLTGLDYSFKGQPFCNIPAKSGLDLGSMDYSFQGQPFVSNPDASGGGTKYNETYSETVSTYRNTDKK